MTVTKGQIIICYLSPDNWDENIVSLAKLFAKSLNVKQLTQRIVRENLLWQDPQQQLATVVTGTWELIMTYNIQLQDTAVAAGPLWLKSMYL